MADLAPSANCVTISYNPDTNQKVYTVEGAWNPGSCYGQVLVVHTEWRDLLAAAEGGGGTTDPTPTTSAFTEAEIVSLKYQAANPSPFNLSLEEGGQVAAAVIAVWSVAWAIRQVVRALGSDGNFSTSD